MSRWYISVSIPYVNAAPHVGYALELVQADALARARRQAGDEVRFVGGTDDHALKNVVAAEAAGTSTEEFVTTHADRFARLRSVLDISFDDFIRTSTDPRHRPGVERLWRQTAARGDLYRHRYEGSYCVGCEQFYAAEDLVDGRCPEHATAVEWVEESNWFFRLSRYRDAITDAITTGALEIAPSTYRNEILAFLRSGVEDISVSRSRRRARGWGIPVPDDDDQVVYVWWDALANYVTALDYGAGGEAFERWWRDADERVHVIGKGILRFHAVYWPALLLSAGLPLPTRIYVHPYLTVEGAKISKSAGNGADPADLVAAFGTDALRWWLCRDVPPHADADFTIERLVARYNEDLANGLGNLAARVTTMLRRFRGGSVPTAERPADAEAVERLLGELVATVRARVGDFDLRAGTSAINDIVAVLNRYIEDAEPWQLARGEQIDPSATADRLDRVLAFLVAALERVAQAATTIIPAGAARVIDQLHPAPTPPPSPSVAFPRIDPPRQELT